jgi:hypothetical protein
MEISMSKREWTGIPQDVHDALRKAQWFLEFVARSLSNEIYNEEANREGMSMDAGFEAYSLDLLMMDYGLPSRREPSWFFEPETDAEAIERRLRSKA